MIRRVITLALLAMGLAAVPLAASPASAAPSVPTGFKLIQYDAGMGQYDLTNFVTIPTTTSMLATGKSGRMTRVDITGDGMDPSDANVTPFAKGMPAYFQGDRGLLGISLAADYLDTKHVFLLWDYCKGGSATDDQACIPDGGLPTGRLSQMTLTGPATAPTGIDFTSEIVVMDDLPSWSPTPGAQCTDSHTIGTVVTAPDGTLFVGNGDGSGYCGSLDPSALSAQDITSPRGKIFHITPDGRGLGMLGSYHDAVYAYGLRNPFRFTLLPGTGGELRVGDVGWNSYEEQDRVTPGDNMGWPCLEGTHTTELSSAPICVNNANNFAATHPLVEWAHRVPPCTPGAPGMDETCTRPKQSAAIGGVVYTATSYPTQYQNQYFYGDYARGDLFYGTDQIPFGALGSWGSITSIQTGIGGDIFVSDIGANGPGKISRIHFVADGNDVPTVNLTASPTIGQAPLTVAFSLGAGDTDGNISTWSLDYGDGSLPLSALNLPPDHEVHVYAQPGSYRAILTVADNVGAQASATVTVNVGNNPPDLNVVQPLGFFHIGDPFHVDATASDPDGDAVSITYQEIIHHCPSPNECHPHPQAIQSSPDFVYPSHGDDTPNYYLEIVVTATDARGAVTHTSVNYLQGDNSTPPPAVTGLRFNPQPPQRLLDTRTDPAPIQGEQEAAINLGAHSAAMLTVTVTQPVAAGFLRVYPCGFNPGTSTVNYNAGQTVSNVAIVTIPADGWVCILSQQTTDVVMDLSGYFDSTGLNYAPIDPTRVLDSRPNPFLAGHQVVFNVAEAPAGAAAMMVNLTVDQPQADGYLRAYPCAGENNTSNVNYAEGQTIANFAAVQSPGGTICFRSFANTQVIADLAGWFVSGDGTSLVSVAPTRLFDTRSTAGFSRLAAGQELAVDLGLPRDAKAAVLNVTAADPSAAGYVQVYPCGTDPKTSSVNYQPHQVAAANMTVVKVPETGQVCFKSFAATDLIVDLSGWFS